MVIIVVVVVVVVVVLSPCRCCSVRLTAHRVSYLTASMASRLFSRSPGSWAPMPRGITRVIFLWTNRVHTTRTHRQAPSGLEMWAGKLHTSAYITSIVIHPRSATLSIPNRPLCWSRLFVCLFVVFVCVVCSDSGVLLEVGQLGADWSIR